MPTYADLSTVQTTNPGDILTAAWCDQTRDNFEIHEDPPACSVFNSAAQSVPNSTDTAMLADSENYDNDAMHSTSSNTSRVTVQTAGRYLFVASVAYAPNNGSRVLTRFQVDGATLYSTDSRVPFASATPTQAAIARTFVLAASSYVEVIVNHNHGSSSNVTLQEFVAVRLTR